jgi:hypothetical protein
MRSRPTAGAARFYKEVVAISCRTCHVSLGATFDWDDIVLTPARAQTNFCGGTAAIAINASMPNALISRDRLFEKIESDASLASPGGAVPRLHGAASRPGL